MWNWSRSLTEVFRRALQPQGSSAARWWRNSKRPLREFCAAGHAVAVSSGTDALRFALMACGVGPGDVVVTVPNTFIATAEAISQARAIPEFVDVDEHTYNMSVQMLERFLEKQCVRNSAGKLISLRSGRPVTAIVPVHLYGQMADMDAILNLADKYGLTVIEDACQAHGAEYFSKRNNRWMKAGSMGRAAAFSFYPGQNLGACGEGGAVTTNDPAIAAKVRMLRDHGQAKKYFHDVEGYNGRLDAIQAGILHAKLPSSRRNGTSSAGIGLRTITGFFRRIGRLIVPFEPSWSRAVYHLYVIRTGNRDGLIEAPERAKASAPEFTIRFRCICKSPTLFLTTHTRIFRWRRAWHLRSYRFRCSRNLPKDSKSELSRRFSPSRGRRCAKKPRSKAASQIRSQRAHNCISESNQPGCN